jgi:hypothetical protein
MGWYNRSVPNLGVAQRRVGEIAEMNCGTLPRIAPGSNLPPPFGLRSRGAQYPFGIWGPSGGHGSPWTTQPQTPTPNFPLLTSGQVSTPTLQRPPWDPQLSLSENMQRGAQSLDFNQRNLLSPNGSAQVHPRNPDSRRGRRPNFMVRSDSATASMAGFSHSRQVSYTSDRQSMQTRSGIPRPSGGSSRPDEVQHSGAGGSGSMPDEEHN